MAKVPTLNLSDAEWAAFSLQERAVQWAAYYADVIGVRERGGNNRGPSVEMFLKTVGLKPGNPWCAAFVSHCLVNSDWFKFKSGGVVAWKEWAESHGCVSSTPSRGSLAFWDHGDASHHIEIVLEDQDGHIRTIGGNTSSGEVGSQNNGDGVYRRVRPTSMFSGFIEWWRV